MIFQDYGIYDWKTVLANVRFGLDLQRVPRHSANARAADWLARTGLADFAHAYPATLSDGMRQRVAVARALAVEPELLLMDEPFAALDAQLRTILQGEFLELTQSTRTTTLFVTHSLEEALVLGDRVLVMSARPGRIIATRRPPFPRPRTGDIRSDREFTALRDDPPPVRLPRPRRHRGAHPARTRARRPSPLRGGDRPRLLTQETPRAGTHSWIPALGFQ